MEAALDSINNLNSSSNGSRYQCIGHQALLSSPFFSRSASFALMPQSHLPVAADLDWVLWLIAHRRTSPQYRGKSSTMCSSSAGSPHCRSQYHCNIGYSSATRSQHPSVSFREVQDMLGSVGI
ncbi:hypothetical protein ABBQ38_000766 [Trebouxia sp. C0009 RCD-2024]